MCRGQRRCRLRCGQLLSGLRSSIEATGGKLDIVARFPQGSVVVTSISDAGEDRIEAGPDPDVVVS